MRLYSWNVNGFRSLCTKPAWQWFYEVKPDVLGMQETKATQEQIPLEYQEPEGYHATWLAASKKKGYSGVAVFSRFTPMSVTLELPDKDFHGEGRCIHIEYPEFHFLNIYFPNGQMGDHRLQYKLAYYDAFLQYAEALRQKKPIVVCGDFNTAHRPIDLARPKENAETSGFLPEERAWLDHFISKGYVDTFRHVHGDETGMYSWWSYRFRARERNAGWRIDYFFISSELLPALKDAWIDMDVLGSDHCPVGIELLF